MIEPGDHEGQEEEDMLLTNLPTEPVIETP